MWFGLGQVGGNISQLEIFDTLCGFYGIQGMFPPTYASALLGAPKKKRGVRTRHGLPASRQLLGIAFETGLGMQDHPPRTYYDYTPGWQKHQSVYHAF